MSDDPTILTLYKPIMIDGAQVTALKIDPAFRVGWLRGMPPVPTWLIAVLRWLLASIPDDVKTEADLAKIDKAELIKSIPLPTGEELTEMAPWLLHMAAKATGRPNDVVDQLHIVDLGKLLLRLIPGLTALPNFQQTPPVGPGTSPGSSTGPQATSTA